MAEAKPAGIFETMIEVGPPAAAHAAAAHGASMDFNVPYSPLYPHSDEIAALKAIGCDFGCAPWLYGSGSPHYGPPGSCINHPYPTCPSQNPYYRFMDARAARGLPTHWSDTSPRSEYLAPISRARIMKKQKKKTRTKSEKASTATQKKRDVFNMNALASALNASEQPVVDSSIATDALADLVGQLLISRPKPKSHRARRTSTRSRNKKKKGGRRTRK